MTQVAAAQLRSEQAGAESVRTVQEGMSLLDQAQRAHEAGEIAVRRLEPANLRAFPLLSKHAPERYLQEFRQLRSRLQRVRVLREAHGQKTRSILVTSPQPGEGKSFVALNLALMIAVAPEARILLADLNVRRPTFQSRFKLPKGPGLEEIIAGAAWRQASWWMPDTQLYVTTLSDSPRDLMDPLHYDKLAARVEALSADFDWIIFDGPALLEGPDAEIASVLADATLLVVRRGETSFAEMDECTHRIAPGRLAGVVYNSAR
jgi:Mrp family chromosome partitioning ATPase